MGQPGWISCGGCGWMFNERDKAEVRVVCRFCRQPIERSGFLDPITGGDGYWHRDGSDVCLTPQPARTLEEDQ